MIWTSRPIEIGPGTVPAAVHVLNTKPQIVAAIGRKGLLGHRGASLVAVAAAELARVRVYGGDAELINPTGVVAVAPRASREAVLEVNSLAVAGRQRAVSILDAPNVSPNVVSASASIRLGARGPAFTVDSTHGGVRSAWRAASAMIDARRCPSVLLIEVIDATDGTALPVAVAAVVSGSRSDATPVPVDCDPFTGPDPGPGVSVLADLWATDVALDTIAGARA